MGNHQFAIDDFNRAISLSPQSWVGYFYRGISYLRSKCIKESEEDLLKARDLDLEKPDAPVGYHKPSSGIYDGLGQVFLAREDFDKALSFFDMAIDKEEGNVEFLTN